MYLKDSFDELRTRFQENGYSDFYEILTFRINNAC